MKNLLYGLNSILEKTENRISKFENISVEVTQSKDRGKLTESRTWRTVPKGPTEYVTGVPKEREEKRAKKKIFFEKKRPKTFQN